MNFYAEDRPVQLIEWLEIQREQGHEKVYLYIQALPPMMEKVAHHYRDSGYVELLPYSYPGDLPHGEPFWVNLKESTESTSQKELRLQMITRNDCFFRLVHDTL